jgi:succinoglycan biosynthesis protein ExoL
MKLAYFVHDLGDPAVDRRVRMLEAVEEIVLAGFRRSDRPIDRVAGREAVDLGRTFDGRFVHRLGLVLESMITTGRWSRRFEGTDVFIARQLETLALAAFVRRRLAPEASLVFECLDIHRLMLRAGPVGALMRFVERRLMHESDLLITSSPGFVSGYFDKVPGGVPEILLLENKVLASDIPPEHWPLVAQCRGRNQAFHVEADPGPPWRIGWYGVIRCRRSLLHLANLVRALPDRVSVVIRGRPSRTAIPDFDQILARAPGIQYLGPYDRATDLPLIYRDVHFTWALDFYEAPGNSDWLLPNRLYEGTLFGCVPIAYSGSQTGEWLRQHDCGLCIQDDLDVSLAQIFEKLSLPAYGRMREKIAHLDLSDLIDDKAACGRVVTVLRDLSKGKASACA